MLLPEDAEARNARSPIKYVRKRRKKQIIDIIDESEEGRDQQTQDSSGRVPEGGPGPCPELIVRAEPTAAGEGNDSA